MIMYLFPTTLWCGETPHLLFTELTLLSLRRGWRENLVRRERNFCEQKEGETVGAGSFSLLEAVTSPFRPAFRDFRERFPDFQHHISSQRDHIEGENDDFLGEE